MFTLFSFRNVNEFFIAIHKISITMLPEERIKQRTKRKRALMNQEFIEDADGGRCRGVNDKTKHLTDRVGVGGNIWVKIRRGVGKDGPLGEGWQRQR